MAPTLKRSAHMHWEDWLSIGVGCVIVISPWLAGAADSEFAVLNAVVIGLMVLSVAGLELGDALQRWEEWIELALGLWLVASPWVLGYNHQTAVSVMHIAFGVVVAVLACFELWQDRSGIPPVRRIGYPRVSAQSPARTNRRRAAANGGRRPTLTAPDARGRPIDVAVRNGAFAMPLQQGEVRDYDFNRSVVEFTMINQGNVILCAISTAAMDDLEGRRGVKPDQRVDQFMRLREVIEERASRKFFEEQAQVDRPVVLRASDFVR